MKFYEFKGPETILKKWDLKLVHWSDHIILSIDISLHVYSAQ